MNKYLNEKEINELKKTQTKANQRKPKRERNKYMVFLRNKSKGEMEKKRTENVLTCNSPETKTRARGPMLLLVARSRSAHEAFGWTCVSELILS